MLLLFRTGSGCVKQDVRRNWKADMGNLKEFLENISKEPVQRSNYFSRIEVGLSMTDEQKEQLASSVLDMVYELSGIFLEKLQIRNVKAFQQYPWSGKVYISHEMVIDGVASNGSGNVSSLFVPVKEDQQFIRSHRRADA